MSVNEWMLLLILLLLFGTYLFLLRLDVRRTAAVFCLSSALGFLAQLGLGRELNLYTSNVTLYVAYVSVAVILVWGAGLTSLWAMHAWLTRTFRIRPGLGIHSLCGLPMLVVLEWIGSNILKVKLHGYEQYAAVIPHLNAMNAPKWLYAYYIGLAILFFYLTRSLGLYREKWGTRRFRLFESPGLRGGEPAE